MQVIVGMDGKEYQVGEGGAYKLQKNGIIGGWNDEGRYRFITKVADKALVVKETVITSENATQFKLARAKKQQLSEEYAMKGLSRLSSDSAMEAWADLAETRAREGLRTDMIGVKSTEIVGKMTGLMPDRRILADDTPNDVGIRLDISKDVLADALAVIHELRSKDTIDGEFDVVK